MNSFKRGRFGFYSTFPEEVVLPNEDNAIRFLKGNGSQILTKKEFEWIVEQAKKFYEYEGVDEYITSFNRINEFAGDPIFDTPVVDGKRMVPYPVHERKPYRKNMKKDWVYYCKWCKTRVSSADHETYVEINRQVSEDFNIYVTFCSEACAENYWYEQILDYMNKNGYDDVFHMDKTVGRS